MALRIALFTLESTLSARAVLDFARAEAHRIVLIGRSSPYRPGMGGMTGQLRQHLRRSGPGFLPYLVVNFGLPQALGDLRRLLGGGALTRLARRHGIPVRSIEDVNGPEAAAALREARPDLIVSLHFDQIFTAATLALAPRGGINVHPSLLPSHRGPLPAFWAMREAPPRFGVTVHRLVPRIDAGAILAQQAMPMPARASASTASRLLHQRGGLLARQVLAAMEAGTGALEPAPPEPLPYCPFPGPAELRAAARDGNRLVRPRDLLAALAAPTG
jgi:folate-dependent phosphoribosylglycinamide formyltransferase PurN